MLGDDNFYVYNDNFYIYREIDKTGRVKHSWILRPDYVSIEKKNGILVYKIQAPKENNKMENLNILALDCATKTGWATLINGQIESGVQDFTKKRGESNGMLFIKFNRWLDDMRSLTDGFDLVVYEQAHHRGGYATELCVGLTTRVEEFAARIGAQCHPIHTGTLKKAIYGSGRANKKDAVKWFKSKFGRDAIDDNEADACALIECILQEGYQ